MFPGLVECLACQDFLAHLEDRGFLAYQVGRGAVVGPVTMPKPILLSKSKHRESFRCAFTTKLHVLAALYLIGARIEQRNVLFDIG